MAGYCGFSMSNNAIFAYENGKIPFSKLPAKIKKIGVENLKRFCPPCEYHHTGKFYNSTDFYDLAEVLAVFGIEESDGYLFEDYKNPEAVEFLKNYKKENTVETFFGLIEWSEWVGTRRHLRKIENKQNGKIEVRTGAKMAKITLENGQIFSKKIENLKINGRRLEFLTK